MAWRCRRQRYRTRLAALAALATSGRDVRPFYCPLCRGWHLP